MSLKNGSMSYIYKDVNKISMFRTIEKFGCVLVVTADEDEVFAPIARMGTLNATVAGILLLLAALLIWGVAGSIVRPINRVVAGLKDAAEGEGDLTKQLEENSRDEVGALARWFNVFVRKIRNIISDIAGNSATLGEASSDRLAEHGAYIYQGQGGYLPDDRWIPVQAED